MFSISAHEYMNRSNIFENSIEEEYKKNNGIYYTDINLSKLIIDYLNIDTSKTVLDPCCGTGSFLYSALSKGCNNIFGIDKDLKTIRLVRELLPNIHVRKYDSIANNATNTLKSVGLEEKVDYLIGNPPYCNLEKDIIIDTKDYHFLRKVKDSGSNLFIAAMYRAFELTKDTGIISYIIPKNFLHISTYSKLRKDILHNKSIISIIDIGAYFNCVRGEQIIITIKNKYCDNNVIDIKRLVNNNFVDCCKVEQKFFKDEILLFKNNSEYSIYCKLENTYEKFGDLCTGYVGRGRSISCNAINGKEIKKFGFKNHKVPQKGNQLFIQNIYSAESGIIASFAGKCFEATQTVTVFTDGDEKMCRYILGILHSRLCNFYLLKFCYNGSKLTMHTDAKYLKKIPLVREYTDLFDQVVNLVKAIEKCEYMSKMWFELLEALNELVYKIYGISDEEKNFIDSEMFSLQSNRWNNDK
ncbi:HsdM family class I SAM-dependent methyltransferase [Candidatus Ruminimicrobiellum ovillum]|uniref:HsdM family class I SAM-dependent methyltransferase n=1 Tax=Candidatus Ruminimicrobiellum ovillum TaxID=1947927 RepID=UPI0035598CA8